MVADGYDRDINPVNSLPAAIAANIMNCTDDNNSDFDMVQVRVCQRHRDRVAAVPPALAAVQRCEPSPPPCVTLPSRIPLLHAPYGG